MILILQISDISSGELTGAGHDEALCKVEESGSPPPRGFSSSVCMLENTIFLLILGSLSHREPCKSSNLACRGSLKDQK